MSRKLLIAAVGGTVRVDLSALAADDADAAADAWQDALVEDDAMDASATVAARPGRDRAAMLARLSQDVTLAALGARRGCAWMLHAAGLALDDGRVVVLVGPSGRGKTTAARTLGAEFGYVSDEAIAVDESGRVFAYRKPLSIIEDPKGAKVQRAPSAVGCRPLPSEPLRVAAIVLLDRRDGGEGEPVVERLDLGDALEELVAQSSFLTAMPAPLQTIERVVALAGGVQRVTYREAASLVDLVPRLAQGAGGASGRVTGSSADAVTRAATDSLAGWFRVPVLDEIALAAPDRVAVLQHHGDDVGTVRVLAGIAPTIRRAAVGASIDHLVGAALAQHGEPHDADARALVEAAVDELVAAGLLEWRAPVWGVRDDVAWTEGKRVVALALSDPAPSPLALEGSAAIVWDAVAQGDAPTDEVVRRAAERSGIHPDDVADDVATFLTELADMRLLERR